MAGRKQATPTTASAAAVTLLLVSLLAVVAVAPAAATRTEYKYDMCGVDLYGMKDACEKYCTRGSREAWPGYACCDAVKGADFDCLCHLKRVIGSMGTIDARRAMQIPSKCGISGVPPAC